jgi:hypothetical protein
MDEWMQTLLTELRKCIHLKASTMQSGVYKILQLEIQLYEVKFRLNIQLKDSVYKLMFGSLDKPKQLIDIHAASYTPKEVLTQIRIFARAGNELKLNTWSFNYFNLVNAFADADIAVIENVEFKVEKEHFHALLSKDDVMCYFVLDHSVDTNAFSYHLDSFPEKIRIPEYTATFVDGILDIGYIVSDVLAAFENMKGTNGKSPSLSTIRLYDAIVELLIAVHRNKRSLNDEEVLGLLKTARTLFEK